MIVECNHCNTKFNLPDEKLKPGGVKIRCTRCKEVFAVPGPEAADDGLSGFEGGDDFSKDTGEDSSIGEGGGEGEGSLGMDDSMDFNMGSDLDEGGGGLDDSSDDGFGLDKGSDSLAGDDSPPDDGFSLDDDSSDDGFGLDDSSDGLAGDDSPPDDDFSLDDDSSDDGFGLDDSSNGLAGDDSPPDDDFSLDDDSNSDGLGVDEGSDDLAFDDDSEFDISSFDDDGGKTIGEDSSDLGFSSPLGGGGGGDDMSLDFESHASDVGVGMGGGLGLDIGGGALGDGGIEPTGGFAPAKMKKSRRTPLVVALVIVLVIVSGAYFAFKAFGGGNLNIESIISMFEGNKNPLDGLEIDKGKEKVKHRYVNNSKAGRILIVEGVVWNRSEVAKGHIKVKLKLYNNKMEVVKESEALCGNIIKNSLLANSPEAEINKLLKKADPANARVEPGKQIGFTLVIFNIPKNSDSFDVEIIEAKNVG